MAADSVSSAEVATTGDLTASDPGVRTIEAAADQAVATMITADAKSAASPVATADELVGSAAPARHSGASAGEKDATASAPAPNGTGASATGLGGARRGTSGHTSADTGTGAAATTRADAGKGSSAPPPVATTTSWTTPAAAPTVRLPDPPPTAAASGPSPGAPVVPDRATPARASGARTAMFEHRRSAAALVVVPTDLPVAATGVSLSVAPAPYVYAIGAPRPPRRAATAARAVGHASSPAAVGQALDHRTPTPRRAPPERGPVAGASSSSGGGAASALWCVVLLSLVACGAQQLRGHRVRLVLPGPVGFPFPQQRPG